MRKCVWNDATCIDGPPYQMNSEKKMCSSGFQARHYFSSKFAQIWKQGSQMHWIYRRIKVVYNESLKKTLAHTR